MSIEDGKQQVIGKRLPFQGAIDAWQGRFELERDAKFEPMRLEQRLAYAEMIKKTKARDVRGYERDMTPERRAEKKATKSKGERLRREARSTPEQIEADKQAARDRAKASYEARKAAPAAPPRMEDDPNYGRF